MATILLIDDEPGIRGVLRMWMESDGHSVTDVADGWQGIATFETLKPDLIITDLFMPEIDGLDFIRAVRSRSDKAKIIAISGRGSGITKGNNFATARTLGAAAAISKPFKLSEFLKVVNAVLQTNEPN